MIGFTNAKASAASATGDWEVRFIDYDGAVIKSEMVVNGGNATPPTGMNKSAISGIRPALTLQEWNNEYTNVVNEIDTGAIYVPTDGKTHAFITTTVTSGNTITFYLNKSDTSELTINYGDETSETSTTSGNISFSHTYADYGTYDVTIWISSGTGTYYFGNGIQGTTFVGGATQVERDTLTAVYIGNNVTTFGVGAFYYCTNLKYATAPQTLTTVSSTSVFFNTALTGFVFPKSATSFSTSSTANFFRDTADTMINVVLHNYNTRLGGYFMFNATKICKFIMGSSFDGISASSALGLYYCTELILNKLTVATLGSLTGIVFPNCIYVPFNQTTETYNTLMAYMVATNWNTLASKFVGFKYFANGETLPATAVNGAITYNITWYKYKCSTDGFSNIITGTVPSKGVYYCKAVAV